MSRKSSGLRNRFRSGRGTYSLQRKSTGADRYGTFHAGVQSSADVIAGRTLTYARRGGSAAAGFDSP